MEVPRCPRGVVVVVAGDGLGAILEPAPGGVVALLEVLSRPVWVGLVAQGEYRAVAYITDEPGRRLVAPPLQSAMSPAATTTGGGGDRSGRQPTATRTATKATMTTVAGLPTPTPPSTYQVFMRIR